MEKTQLSLLQAIVEETPTRQERIFVAKLIVDGDPSQVKIIGRTGQPESVRWLSGIDGVELAHHSNNGREVLVVYPDGAGQAPVMLGLVGGGLDNVVETSSRKKDNDQVTGMATANAIVDGQNVIVQASERIELRCGAGSISIEKSGKIAIKGTNLLSLSTGEQRIRGAHVSIN